MLPMWTSLSRLARSFRFRLMLWHVAILAVILVAAGSYVYFFDAHALLEAFNARLETRIAALEDSLNRQTGLLAPAAAEDPIIDNELVLLLTSQGQIVQSFGGFPAQTLAPVIAATVSSQGHLGNTRFFSLQPEHGGGAGMIYGCNSSVVRVGQHELFLVIGFPSDIPQQQQQLLVILVVALPAILLLSTGGGFWLANHAMRPVHAIARTAQQISEGDLRQRLHLARRDEVGELAATFDHMLDRLEEAFERQRQFTADASHELRTPLTIIDLEANRALTQALTPGEYQQAIALIQQENRTMTCLVNDLLTLARADSGQALFKREAVDLSEVVLEVVERLTLLASRQGMTITVGDLPELVLAGDRQYLAQAVTNLIENSLKHGAPVGGEVSIAMGSEYKNTQPWVRLRVSDNGPGIAVEHLPHLFERFYRVDQVRTRYRESSDVPFMELERPGGNGLGLSITQWIVEAHGGQIHVQSTVGHGTTFEVWLPIYHRDGLAELR
jgi:signal transduction histidine kinase